MPFYRFEDFESHHFNPHLSTAVGPVIEGEYMYFRLVEKHAGTGARMHYHPNELMAFPLECRINCMVGKDRRVVTPGTFVHIPPFARHEFFATEDRDLRYLYIKDRTWTLIGAASDEALPDRALSSMQVQREVAAGRYPGGEKAPEKSQAIIEGLGNCYYPMIDGLDAPRASGHFERWVEGTHIAFGFVESPQGHAVQTERAAHETFMYVIGGSLDADINGERRTLVAGDVAHVPRTGSSRWTVASPEGIRYAAVRSLDRLEAAIHAHGAADNWRG